MTELEPVADELVKKACEAFAETYVTYPNECASTPITEWFKLDAQDAVDFGVLAEPKWHGISDIRVMEHEQYVAAVIRNPMRAALSSAQSAIAERDARIADLERKAAMLEASAGFAIDDVNRAIARAEAAESRLKEVGKARAVC